MDSQPQRGKTDEEKDAGKLKRGRTRKE